MTEFLFSLYIILIHLYKSQRILNNTDVEINQVVDNKTNQNKINIEISI
jgi:hypothetical protein